MTENELRSSLLNHYYHNVVRIENAPGGTPGLPDILYFPNSKLAPSPIIALELKSPGKNLSRAQLIISRKCTMNKVPYMVLRFDNKSRKLELSIMVIGKTSVISWRTLFFSHIAQLRDKVLSLMIIWEEESSHA